MTKQNAIKMLESVWEGNWASHEEEGETEKQCRNLPK